MNRFTLFAICFIFTNLAFAQIQMPQPSPTQSLTQNFGIGKIMLTYSRPSIKGRSLFEDSSDLAPLGKIWRTGANAATKITFTDFVNFGGKDLDSGSYAIYAVPAKDEWEIILNKGITNNGTDGYKESDDVYRFKAPAEKTNAAPVESFTMQFEDIKPESCALHLTWGNTDVTIPLTTNIKDRIKTQIETAMQGNDKPYWQAANFYYDWEKNYSAALENVNHALEQNPNAFYMYMLKAKIQKAMDDKTGAKTSAQKCIELASAANNMDYVKQANDLIKNL